MLICNVKLKNECHLIKQHSSNQGRSGSELASAPVHFGLAITIHIDLLRRMNGLASASRENDLATLRIYIR